MTDKLIGCTRLVDVTTVPMFRPSNRVPFGVFCKVHRNRLIRHNCCPTCGVFCTQVREQVTESSESGKINYFRVLLLNAL